MNSEHEAHLVRRQAQIAKLLDWKYRKGQREHGGKLWEHSAAWLIQQAIEEAVDSLFYLLDAVEKAQPDCYCRVKLPVQEAPVSTPSGQPAAVDGNDETQRCGHPPDCDGRCCRSREDA